ncbi:hypothetical protein AA313_de0209110 [Arthrobotrys entomopaga]|nr:hypothetical protein AA313_de0209110 [Arthrobotrys entomopaga]
MSASGSGLGAPRVRVSPDLNFPMVKNFPMFYPHPLDPDYDPSEPLTFREQYLRNFSQAVRDKPNWTEKILDRTLVTKWLREAQAQDRISSWRKVMTWNRDDIDFVYDELVNRYKPYVEELRKDPATAGVEPDMDCVWRSDSLVDEGLRKDLIDAVATLENVPDEEKDWHPGSDKMVLDLVHPSLWPVIYGRSISLTDGKPIRLPEDAEDDSFSDKYCWLPSEFEINKDGKVRIASYINNLTSPEQTKLFYPILERIFERFVPLFNHVLGDLNREFYLQKRVSSPDGYVGDGEEVEYITPESHEKLWNTMLGEFERGEEISIDFDENIMTFADDEEGEKKREELEESGWAMGDDDEKTQAAPYQVREMGKLEDDMMWEAPVITDKVKLQGKTAKVIVKLANIILTPEKPRYDGGTWHVEAMLNERIVSTGIYYYAQENITDSSLAFRRTTENMEDMMYSLPQDSNWTTVHNMDRDGNSVQEIGSIPTKENRAIAFPNIYQHQVQPFQLIDNTKPGYRKILVFFLCDPNERDLPTSRTVAAQQPEARQYVEEALRQGPLGKLPEEVFRLIVEELPPVVSRQEAEDYREDLMKERSSYIMDNEIVQGASYSL